MRSCIKGSFDNYRQFKITLSYDDSRGDRMEKVFSCAKSVWYETFWFYDGQCYDEFLKTIEFADAGIKGRSFTYTICSEVDKSSLTIKTNGIIFNDIITLYA
jgi:hypothetical protein